jgi:hypothetical protein
MDEPRSRTRNEACGTPELDNAASAYSPSTAWHLFAAAAEPNPVAIIVRCSDPRFQTAFDQFISQELGLGIGDSIPIIVGGGAGVLGHPEQLPKESKFLRERIAYYRRRYPSVRRIILINHEGCRYYEWVENRTLGVLGPRFGSAPEEPLEDLTAIARNVVPFAVELGCKTEFYYARFTDPGHSGIVIEPVEV